MKRSKLRLEQAAAQNETVVAGHYVGHHGVIGAMTGCAVGHHMAAKTKREKLRQDEQQQSQTHG
jgi:hypothetical protein